MLIESEFNHDYSRFHFRINECFETTIDRIDVIRLERHEVEELVLKRLFPFFCLSMEVHDEHIPQEVISGRR